MICPVDRQVAAGHRVRLREAVPARLLVAAMDELLCTYRVPACRSSHRILWVPKTSSKSCDQAIFVDQATDASLPPDAVLVEIERFG